MRIVLYGTSSFSHWLTTRTAPSDTDRVSAKALVQCEPTHASLQHIESRFPFIPRPYHLSTTARGRSKVEDAQKHLCVKRPVGKPFCHIADGIYASSPELCFVQLARTYSPHELVRAGNVLCGAFFIDVEAGERLESRVPLMSKRRIEAHLRVNPGIPGSKKARQALPWITEGTASPPEAFLAMVLGLPFRCGGFQIPRLLANRRLKMSPKAQEIAHRSTLVPDLLIPETRLVVEYDSTAEHTSARQLTRDAQKRLALEYEGYKVITVTTKQLASRAEMRRVAEEVYRHLGRRLRPQSHSFNAQQASLFQMGWALDANWYSEHSV